MMGKVFNMFIIHVTVVEFAFFQASFRLYQHIVSYIALLINITLLSQHYGRCVDFIHLFCLQQPIIFHVTFLVTITLLSDILGAFHSLGNSVISQAPLRKIFRFETQNPKNQFAALTNLVKKDTSKDKNFMHLHQTPYIYLASPRRRHHNPLNTACHNRCTGLHSSQKRLRT